MLATKNYLDLKTEGEWCWDICDGNPPHAHPGIIRGHMHNAHLRGMERWRLRAAGGKRVRIEGAMRAHRLGMVGCGAESGVAGG